jgi:hypothetical protein
LLRLSFTVVVPFVLACGSGSSNSTTAGTGGETGSTSSSGAGGMAAGGIPGPGTGDGVDNDFTSMPGDGTPQTATPLGVSTSTMGLNVWVGGNSIGGAGNDANYFVFESGPAMQPFTFDVCFNPPITAMTASLWKVSGGKQVMPPLGTWQSTGTCVTNMGSAMVNLEASTEYLFGVTATGGSGMYSA